MRFGPPVQFVRRPDGHDLAYQVLGDAPLDLVFLGAPELNVGAPRVLGTRRCW
jgi:hypothetical protein